jgi:hypothetical protein
MDKILKLKKLNAQLKKVDDSERDLRVKLAAVQSKRLKLATDIYYLKESMQPDFGPRVEIK